MKRNPIVKPRRVLAALLAATLLFGLCFAGAAAPASVYVANASELAAALSDAATSGDATIIYYAAGTSEITLSGSLSVPSNVTLDLSTTGGTLSVPSATVLEVSGAITGGAVAVSGGTLLRAPGSSITATITASAGGTVRGARTLSLENLSTSSSETITAVTYAGESTADTSSYVTRLAEAVLYVKLTGANYSSYQTIETIVTSAGNVFRLGTKYTDTLSLTYALTYGGLAGASLTTLNPSSYTASDAAIQLNNPTKEGFVFAGWTCEALGVTAPQETMVIPEGTTGALTLIAVWTEAPGGMGGGGGKSGGSVTTATEDTQDDAEAQQEQAAAEEQAAIPQQSTRRTRTASSSTKVTFTSDVDTVAPSLESVRSGSSFPWAWVFGGLAVLGALAILAARRANRRQSGK